MGIYIIIICFLSVILLLNKTAVSVEKVLSIVYQPQAVFRIRPVNRCSATIAGIQSVFSHTSLYHLCPHLSRIHMMLNAITL